MQYQNLDPMYGKCDRMYPDSEQRFIRTLIEDPDDPEGVMIELGEELCEKLGWREGDIVEWIDNKDGTWTLKKQS